MTGQKECAYIIKILVHQTYRTHAQESIVRCPQTSAAAGNQHLHVRTDVKRRNKSKELQALILKLPTVHAYKFMFSLNRPVVMFHIKGKKEYNEW